jgi:indolepyruvate ferredoxin oxidoreductase beta subunit
VTAESARPISILIAALGGEGGGVLSTWLVEAATIAGFPVQSTSIPGVAQRTGATTYYVEIFPVPLAELKGREPVMTLTPGPGDIDLMVASELLEAGRAMQNGFISPDRTTLIASTHRLYSVSEKTVSADGRFDADQIVKAAPQLAEQALLGDFRKLAEQSGSIINSVLLGAMAASAKLPFGREVLEETIRKSGIAVEANLKGLAAGFAAAALGDVPESASEPPTEPVLESLKTRRRAKLLLERIAQTFPPETHELVKAGVLRVVDFQDVRYGRLYLERLERIVKLEPPESSSSAYALTNATARNLALWMAYEDVIRVADLKTRPERMARIREEVRARPEQVVEVVDYLKPGIEELCALLPRMLAEPILRWAEQKNRLERFHFGMHLRTTSVSGFLLIKGLTWFRPLRRFTHRFEFEQALIERWLALVPRAASQTVELALEIVECARLLKGYGDTHQRGLDNFQTLLDRVIEPGLASSNCEQLTVTIREAREQVLQNPEAVSLQDKFPIPSFSKP